MTALLEIADYRLAFDTFDGTSQVLDGIDLALEAGGTLGIVGETGCGKSVLARSLMALNPMPPARVVWLPVISLLTTAVALHTADAVGWVPALVFAVYLVAFLIPRGNAVAGCVGSALLIGAGLAWALPQQPSVAAVAEMLKTQGLRAHALTGCTGST